MLRFLPVAVEDPRFFGQGAGSVRKSPKLRETKDEEVGSQSNEFCVVLKREFVAK